MVSSVGEYGKNARKQYNGRRNACSGGVADKTIGCGYRGGGNCQHAGGKTGDLPVAKHRALPLRLVAKASYSDDKPRMRRIVLNLVTQALDVDGERVFLDIGTRIIPKGIANHVS